MKKKLHQRMRTLDLSAETIRHLSPVRLAEVMGANKPEPITSSSCDHCSATCV
jgi:hypothetical protein